MTFLLVVIVLVGLGVVGFLIYAGGALLSRDKQPKPSITHVQHIQLPTMPTSPPTIPTRIARGTTPQPLPHDTAPYARAESPIPGVISNREDATERTISPDDRFSIRRSRPRY